MEEDIIYLDLRGLRCPLPVLRLRKLTQSLLANTIIDVQISDRAALKDIPAYALERRWRVLSFVDKADQLSIKLQL